MNRCFATGMFGAVLILGIASAHAGPCTAEIAQFEQAVRQSASDPNAGPMLPQTVGAQLDRQPTPALVERAEKRALARARAMYNM